MGLHQCWRLYVSCCLSAPTALGFPVIMLLFCWVGFKNHLLSSKWKKCRKDCMLTRRLHYFKRARYILSHWTRRWPLFPFYSHGQSFDYFDSLKFEVLKVPASGVLPLQGVGHYYSFTWRWWACLFSMAWICSRNFSASLYSSRISWYSIFAFSFSIILIFFLWTKTCTVRKKTSNQVRIVTTVYKYLLGEVLVGSITLLYILVFVIMTMYLVAMIVSLIVVTSFLVVAMTLLLVVTVVSCLSVWNKES